jgi:hypothetical protein
MAETTVWILGAGFSKPLGGPMLTDLLAPDSVENLRATYSRNYTRLFSKAALVAHWLFNYGTRFRAGRIDGSAERDMAQWIGPLWATAIGEQLWVDAEDYLDYLDTSVASETSRAGRQMAAECCAFLTGADTRSERFAPYVRWARELVQPGDSVLTFNYDLVPDRLASGSKLRVLAPSEAPQPGFVNVIKLHGSVNWRRAGETRPSEINVEADLEFALSCEDRELAIASPGPTKQTITRQLEPLWGVAESAIKSANAIVFVGYRFPPTDANARTRLLSAIAGSQMRYVAVHTVLGPKVDDNTVRLTQMLRYALRSRFEHPTGPDQPTEAGYNLDQRFNLVPQPLWAEDFFSVAAGGIIMQPYYRRKDKYW